MIGKKRLCKYQWLLARCLSVFIVSLFFGNIPAKSSIADTVYERSMKMLEKKAVTTSPDDFCFVVMGDSKDSDDVFRKIMKLASSFKPLFILHVGDFSPNGSSSEVDHFLELVNGGIPDIPLFVVPGNHEQKEPFLKKIGPLEFTMDNPRMNLRLVALDNSDYSLKPSQLKYLEKQLAVNRKYLFAAMHIPPFTERWNWHTFSEGASTLKILLADKKATAAFYGHIHIYDRDDIKGVPHFVTGGAGATLTRFGFQGDPVYHVLLVTAKDGKVTYEAVKLKK